MTAETGKSRFGSLFVGLMPVSHRMPRSSVAFEYLRKRKRSGTLDDLSRGPPQSTADSAALMHDDTASVPFLPSGTQSERDSQVDHTTEDRSAIPMVSPLLPVVDCASSNEQERIRELLPPDDIRRRWPFLLTKVFQSMGACGKTKKHLLQFLYPDCVYVHNFRGEFNPYSPRRIELHGIDAITNYLDQTAISMPDGLFSLWGSRLRLLENNHCAVIVQMVFKGTKVFRLNHSKFKSIVVKPKAAAAASGDVDLTSPYASQAIDSFDATVHAASLPVDEGDGDGMVSLTGSTTDEHSATTDEPSVPDVNDLVVAMNEFHIQDVITEEPKICVVGTYTFYTDEHKKCYRMEGLYLI